MNDYARVSMGSYVMGEFVYPFPTLGECQAADLQ